jgi:hypothetical protein
MNRVPQRERVGIPALAHRRAQLLGHMRGVVILTHLPKIAEPERRLGPLLKQRVEPRERGLGEQTGAKLWVAACASRRRSLREQRARFFVRRHLQRIKVSRVRGGSSTTEISDMLHCM